jgi:hypothetical protein
MTTGSRFIRMIASNKHVQTRFWTILIVFLIYLCWIWLLPIPPHWATLSATSEYIGYRVIDPDVSTLRVGGMFGAVIGDNSRDLGCIEAIVTPSQSAWVEYRRGDKEQLTISIEPSGNGPAANIARGESDAGPIVGKLKLTFDRSCAGTAPRRFPISGPAAFGEELAPPGAAGESPPSFLLKGTVDVYALSLHRLILITLPEVVYSVMTFDVPPGVAICADARKEQTLGEPPNLPCPDRRPRKSAPPDVIADSAVAWSGVAFPSASTSGFDLVASTNAPSLVLQSTRTFGQAISTRRLDLGRHAQMLKDPNFLWLHFLGGMFLVFLQAGSWLARLWRRQPDPID